MSNNLSKAWLLYTLSYILTFSPALIIIIVSASLRIIMDHSGISCLTIKCIELLAIMPPKSIPNYLKSTIGGRDTLRNMGLIVRLLYRKPVLRYITKYPPIAWVNYTEKLSTTVRAAKLKPISDMSYLYIFWINLICYKDSADRYLVYLLVF